MDRRLPGELTSEQLTQNNTHMRDYLAARCNPGTVDDKDNGLPVSIALSSVIAKCETSGATAAKVATVENFADFELQPGMEITVYFANKNTASNPTLNVASTGALPITVAGQQAGVSLGSGCFESGFYDFKYIDLTVNGTRFQQWMIKNSNVVEKTNDYVKYGDGTIVYNKNAIDNKVPTFEYKYVEVNGLTSGMPVLVDNTRNWLNANACVWLASCNYGGTNYHGITFANAIDGALYFMPYESTYNLVQIRLKIVNFD